MRRHPTGRHVGQAARGRGGDLGRIVVDQIGLGRFVVNGRTLHDLEHIIIGHAATTR